MPRPTSKSDLLTLSQQNFEKLMQFADSMSDRERETPFDFSGDKSKTEAHWGRDKNLRDVYIHLYEWHRLLINWVGSNMNGGSITFLPAPYNWKNYGDMNRAFWQAHQETETDSARKMLEATHREVMALAEKLSEEELYTRGYFDWTGNNALASYFISNTSSHYDWALRKLKAHRRKCS